MAGKEYPLSITLRTVDRASDGLKRINDRLEKTFKPLEKVGKEFDRLHGHLGLDRIGTGLRGLRSLTGDLARSVGVAAGAAGVAGLAFKRLVDDYDALATRADRIGITVDALAQLEHAAARSDVEAGELNSSLRDFSKSVGQARLGTGRLASLLKKVDPIFLKQIKSAKSYEGALDLMADAITKLESPAEQTALAVAAFGGSGAAMLPLLRKGSGGIAELMAEFKRLAGPQQGAADAAGAIDDELKKLKGSMQGVKASILVGLGPAFLELADRAGAFLERNQAQIAAWIKDFGDKLPERLERLGGVLSGIWDGVTAVGRAIGWVVDKLGGAESAVKILVGAWVAFKGLKLVTSLGSIAGGLWKMATAAKAAAASMAGVGRGATALPAAAAVAGGGAQLALPFAGGAAAAGGAGKVGRLAAVGRVGGKLVRGAGAAGAVVGSFDAGYTLGTFLDEKFGLSDKLSGTEQQLFGPAWIQKAVSAGAFNRRDVDGFFGKRGLIPQSVQDAAQAKVTIEVKGPPGTRTSVDPASTADVDVSTGVSMVGP